MRSVSDILLEQNELRMRATTELPPEAYERRGLKVTDAVLQEMKDLEAKGVPRSDIAKQTGVSGPHVSRRLGGSDRRGRERKVTETVLTEIRRLVAAGLTFKAIAGRLGIAPVSVSRWANGKGPRGKGAAQ